MDDQAFTFKISKASFNGVRLIPSALAKSCSGTGNPGVNFSSRIICRKTSAASQARLWRGAMAGPSAKSVLKLIRALLIYPNSKQQGRGAVAVPSVARALGRPNGESGAGKRQI